MSENTKSPEVLMGEAFANAIAPTLAQQGEQIKALTETLTETKSAKEELEAKSKEIEAKAEAEIKSVKEEFHARLDEMNEKKSVNVSGATQVIDYSTLNYQVKSDVASSFLDGTQYNQEHGQKALFLYKTFAEKYPELSQKYNIPQVLNYIEEKSIVHNSTDANLGGILRNAPFILDMIVQQSGESIIRKYATVASANTTVIEIPYLMKEGQAKTRSVGQDFEDNIAANFATKSVTAAEVYAPATFDINTSLTMSEKMGMLLSQVENNLRYNVYAKLDNYYLGGGVITQGSQGRIESIIPDASNQYEYQNNIADASYQMQLGKIGFVKSGANGDVTFDSLNRLSLSLPQNGKRKVFMCHSAVYERIKGIKDTAGNQYLLNGNGINLFNQEITGINGAQIVINDRLPLDTAIYGDIAGGYTIVDSFGGYNMLSRPGTNNSGVNRIIARVFSTAMITSYQAYRLYKLVA